MVKVTLKGKSAVGNSIVEEHLRVVRIDVSEGHLYVGGQGLAKTVAIYAPGEWASAVVVDEQTAAS